MKKRILLFLFIITIFTSNISFASDIDIPEPSKYFYVYDEADLLNREAEDYIIDINEELYDATGAQVVVVTLNSLNNVDINLFAVKLFEEWGIGSSEYDNGLLMLIVPNEGEMWIEVGYGLEGALPDSKVGNLIENSILPYFRENNYQDGIISGFNGIIQEVEEEYNIQLEGQDINEDLYYVGQNGESASVFEGVKAVLAVIGILVFLFIDFKFFNGFLTFNILLRGRRGGGYYGGDRGNRGGGGRSGGGGAGGKW